MLCLYFRKKHQSRKKCRACMRKCFHNVGHTTCFFWWRGWVVNEGSVCFNSHCVARDLNLVSFKSIKLLKSALLSQRSALLSQRSALLSQRSALLSQRSALLSQRSALLSHTAERKRKTN